MNKGVYRCITVSDIHLFHKKTPTEKILQELEYYFLGDKAKVVDTIYIGGDIYDDLVSYDNIDTVLTEKFFVKWFNWAKKHDVQIRILKGTPSHDRDQIKHLVHLNTELNINADVKYFDDLVIEYNEKYDLHVLYIPDEYDHYPENTFLKVQEKLRELNLEQVDISIMHGSFTYQLPEISRAPKHDEASYLGITKYFISVGHVHTYSQYERIFAQGSFSRLKHGEEEAKGYLEHHIYGDGRMEHIFHENKLASLYKTIDVRGLSVEDCLKRLEESCRQYPVGSSVRIHATKGDPILVEKNYAQLLAGFVGLIWSVKIDDPDLTITEELVPRVNINYQPITITKENILEKIESRLKERSYQDTDISKMMNLLKKEI